MARNPYPLQWPDGWKRTSFRKEPRFSGHFARDRNSIINQLRMRGGSQIVITSDLPLRNDGLPYANGACNDPGLAIYWVERGHEQVIACDRWVNISFNMRAIDLSINALRGLDRWGASEMVERAFAGFAALPSGPVERSWRDIIGGEWPSLDPSELLAIARARHRNAIKTAHPDAGGSHERAAELNAALAKAEVELAQ